MRHLFRILIIVMLTTYLSGCMDYGPYNEEEFALPGRGVLITNEGNYMYGNASLSYYSPDSKKVENEVFVRANAAKLGDVAQSVVLHRGKGYVVVNNSGVIFEINTDTFKVTGMITGLNSPRYIHFLSDTKAYVTDLNDSRITVVNPQTKQITGYVNMGNHPSTEQMVQYGRYVFVNCWSYDNKILVVDSESDTMVDMIEVGIQPIALEIDADNKIWTITDGGYEGSKYGYEAPALYRIDAETRSVEKIFRFSKGDAPSGLTMNGSRDKLYFINRSVWRMDIDDIQLPDEPFIDYRDTRYYGIAVDPYTSEVYVADAIDYQQPGRIYRYTSDAVLVDSFTVGVSPGEFCFKY